MTHTTAISGNVAPHGSRLLHVTRSATPKWPSPLGVRTRLVASSALMLFLELALIRWTGSNIVHLSYFTNFVLLGSFLGIGLGIPAGPGRAKRLPYYSPIMLGLLVAGDRLRSPVTVDRGSSTSVIYFTSLNTTGPPAWVILPIIFVAAAVVLTGPAELVGRCFPELPRLTAYRYDLIGSLIGIAAVHRAVVPERAAGRGGALIATVAFGALLIPRPRSPAPCASHRAECRDRAGAAAGDGRRARHESTRPEHSWSPYYKVTNQAAAPGTACRC